MLLDYNRGAIDYDNILTIQFDAGAGGGGFDAAAVLLNTWTDSKENLIMVLLMKTTHI